MGNEQSCQRFRQGAKIAACNTMNRVKQRGSAPCTIISRYRDSFGVSDRADTGASVRSQEFTVDIYYNCGFHFSFCKTSMEPWNPLQKKGSLTTEFWKCSANEFSFSRSLLWANTAYICRYKNALQPQSTSEQHQVHDMAVGAFISTVSKGVLLIIIIGDIWLV